MPFSSTFFCGIHLSEFEFEAEKLKAFWKLTTAVKLKKETELNQKSLVFIVNSAENVLWWSR